MVRTRPSESSTAPVKRRRTFFASSLAMFPNLPTFSSSKPAITPRAQVLAALSDPQDQVKPPSAGDEPQRKSKAGESEVTRSLNGEANGQNAQKTTTTSRTTTRVSPPMDSPSKTRPLRTRTSTKSLSKTTRSSPPPSTPKTSTSASIKRIRVKAVRPTQVLETPKARPTKADNAQHSNERLSAMMQLSMRATIGGRDRPYMRVPVWSEPHHETKTVKIKAPAKRPSHMTARQKASVAAAAAKVKKERQGPRTVAVAKTMRARQQTKSKGKGKQKQEEYENEIEDEMDELEEEVDELEEEVDEYEEEQPTTCKSIGKEKEKAGSSKTDKEYMSSGFYCQDANVKSPFKLINRVLNRASPSRTKGVGGVGGKKGKKRGDRTRPSSKGGVQVTFPPLPYDHGYQHFFEQEHEFILPYNIQKAAQSGALNDKKKPAPYQKIRGNVFPERSRVSTDRAICKCDPESGCGDNCINRIMSYLCGKDCPCGEQCTNRSLTKRPVAPTKVAWAGSRGFGLVALEDIKEGDFVTDYRGEVILLNTFYHRIRNEYAGQRNFYALAYDQDEVIDSGMRGNDARFINHGCNPNLEVRKMQTLGDGQDEFEIGMWSNCDIKKGDELFYDYNFDCFGTAKDELRTMCRCGAPNCVGYLGRKPGEKSAKEIAVGLQAKKAADAARAAARGRRGFKKPLKNPFRRLGGGGKRGVKFSSAMERAKRAIANGSKRAPVVPKRNGVDVRKWAQDNAVEAPGVSMDPPPTAGPSTSTSISTAPPQTPLQTLAHDREPTSPEKRDSPSSRKSGWAKWLRKIAAEKHRTIEEWHEERIKRRRGIAWMNMMIAEFGVAPSPSDAPLTPQAYSDGRPPAGSVNSFANTLAARGMGSKGVKDLGGRSNLVRDRKREFGDGAWVTPSGSRTASMSPTKRAPAGEGPGEDEDPLERSAQRGKSAEEWGGGREPSKQRSIAARNGAPMGWAFVTEDTTKASREPVIDLDLPRSARRARTSLQ